MCCQVTADSGPFTCDICQLAKEDHRACLMSKLNGRNWSTEMPGTGYGKQLRVRLYSAWEKNNFPQEASSGDPDLQCISIAFPLIDVLRP